MKRLLSLILAISVAFAVPAKADQYDPKTIAGAALLTAGISSACIAAELWANYKDEKNKLKKELQTAHIYYNHADADERKKKNFLRMTGGYVAGIVSFSTISTGLLLLAYNYFKQ